MQFSLLFGDTAWLYFSGGRTIGMRTIDMRTIGMRTIGMEDNWHAENWHGRQLELTFLTVSYLITLMF